MIVCRNYLWIVLNRFLIMSWSKHMACMGNYCFWLAEILNIFSETTHLNDVLVGTNNICEVLHRNFSLYMDLLRKSNIGETPSELRNLFKLKRSSINTSKTNIYFRGVRMFKRHFQQYFSYIVMVFYWWR